jgi:hypothetical protein
MKRLWLHQGDGQSPWSIGGAHYFPDYAADDSLLIAIRCRFGAESEEQMALLDTAAPWSICKKEVADIIGISKEADGLMDESLSTRYGKIRGFLARCEMALITEFGQQLNANGTCFISDEWLGPNVIGWKGCLERIRFAIDPSVNIIFYGQY